MRDAFGGIFTLNLVLVFIFIYVSFTAVSLNYAKAFRLKNAVIDFVEQNEIVSLNDIDKRTGLKGKLDDILEKHSYNKTCESVGMEQGTKKNVLGITTAYCYNGIVITQKEEKKVPGTSNKVSNIYYEVKTYATWELGALNKLLTLAGAGEDDVLAGTWAVRGEAKVVYKK